MNTRRKKKFISQNPLLKDARTECLRFFSTVGEVMAPHLVTSAQLRRIIPSVNDATPSRSDWFTEGMEQSIWLDGEKEKMTMSCLANSNGRPRGFANLFPILVYRPEKYTFKSKHPVRFVKKNRMCCGYLHSSKAFGTVLKNPIHCRPTYIWNQWLHLVRFIWMYYYLKCY